MASGLRSCRSRQRSSARSRRSRRRRSRLGREAIEPSRPTGCSTPAIGLGAPLGKVQPGDVAGARQVPAAKAAGASSVCSTSPRPRPTARAGSRRGRAASRCRRRRRSTSSRTGSRPTPVVVELGGGAVCIATYAPVHLVADVSGWFTGGRRLTATSPNRHPRHPRDRRPAAVAGSERRLQVGRHRRTSRPAPAVRRGQPHRRRAADGRLGGRLPVRFADEQLDGQLQRRRDRRQPHVVAVAGGDICLRSWGTTELVVDTYGWSAGDGELQVQSPQRLLDTRDPADVAVRPGAEPVRR